MNPRGFFAGEVASAIVQVVTPMSLGTQLRLDATPDGARLTIGAARVFDLADPDGLLDAAALPTLLDSVLPPDRPLDSGAAKPAGEVLVLATAATEGAARRVALDTADRRAPPGTAADAFGPIAPAPLPWRDAGWAAGFPVAPTGRAAARAQVAPEDQRLAGFAAPGTPFRLDGFTNTPIAGRLPAHAVRGFVLRRGQERAEEVTLAIDTVVLIPERRHGLVIARGEVAVADRDAEDVAALLLALEDADRPRPADHYRDELTRRLDPARAALLAFDERPLLPEAAPPATPEPGDGRAGTLRRLLDHRVAAIAEAAGVAPPEAPAEPAPEPIVSAAALTARRADLAGLVDHADAIERAAREAAADLQPRAAAERERAGAALGAATDATAERSVWPALPPDLDGATAEAVAATRRRVDALDLAAAARHAPEPTAGPVDAGTAAARRRALLALLEAGESPQGRDLAGADLAGLDLSGRALAGAVLDGADLRDAKLAGADLRGAVLAGACLDRADLRDARLDDANLSRASAVGAVLTGATLTGARMLRAALAEADLGGADLSRVEAMAADLDGARLDDARLAGASLLRAALAGASLRGAVLDGALLLEARLAGADLTGASLRRACLVGVDAAGARFDDADLTLLQTGGDASFAGASLLRVRAGRSAWRGADLSRADFARARLDGADLGRTRLTGARLALASLRDAILAGADLEDADGRRADFLGAVLRRARLDGADLRQANLYDAELDVAALAGAHVDGANLPPTLAAALAGVP